MKNGCRCSLKIIISLLIISILTSTFAVSQVDDDYIRSPSNIPEFTFEQTSSIKKGNSGEFNFNLENRYTFDMKNVSLQINIFKFVMSNFSKEIEKVNNTPTITSGSGGDKNTILDDETIQFRWTVMKNNTTYPVKFNISTSSKTPDGTYFVRTSLTFEYQSQIYIMKSRGHFTQEEWDFADKTGSPTDPGEINLTALGVDGIITDTSFRVENGFEDHIPHIICTILWFLAPIIFIIFIILFILHRFFKKARRG